MGKKRKGIGKSELCRSSSDWLFGRGRFGGRKIGFDESAVCCEVEFEGGRIGICFTRNFISSMFKVPVL